MEIKTENGKSYVNHESVPVEFIRHKDDKLPEIGNYLKTIGVRDGDQIVEYNDRPYLCIVDSYRDVDEEDPSVGDYYVIFPSKKVVLYTPSEFEANFKMV